MWAKHQNYTAPKGFTIVELVVVIVVITILAAITVVGYRGAQDKARGTAMNATASQWAETVEVQFVKSPLTSTPGRKSCLGMSAADYPAQDGFGAGRCIDYIGIPGHSAAQADSLEWYGEKYNEVLYTETNWWTNKKGAFDGLVVSPTELTFSNGARMRQRGVIAWTEPVSGASPRVRFLWVVPSSIECVKGADWTTNWFNSVKFLYTAQFSSSTIVTSGKMCTRLITNN